MSEEKSYGDICHNAYWGHKGDLLSKSWEVAAQAVITEFLHRNGKPIGWLNVKYGMFFFPAQIAAAGLNEERIASGELIKVFAAPQPRQQSDVTPIAWLDDEGRLVRRSDILSGGYIDPDRAVPAGICRY